MNKQVTIQSVFTGLGLATAGTIMIFAGSPNAAKGGGGDDYGHLPDTLELGAVIRDFKAKQESGGHPDFQSYSGTTTVGLVDTELGPDDVPVASNTLRGWKISSEFKDANGQNINPAMYDPERGDRAGSIANGPSSNGLTSADSFDVWYKDVPGVNLSKAIPLVLERVPNSNKYVFDSAQHAPYSSIGGFFPVDDTLYGNYYNGHNFHFTTEVRTTFNYQRNSGQVFKFTGDDDVWVFINGKLVIDLGGLHPKREQFLELDRLDWLDNGEECTLAIFHAERRTTASNFRIETTLQLRSAELPTTAVLYD